jgi:hypothetical protein
MDMLIGLIVIVGGFGFIYLGVSFRKDAQDSLGWPKTDGAVQSSTVIRSDGVGPASNHYKPGVEYSYSVEGKQYSGEDMVIGPTGTLPWLAKKEAEQYPVGSRVQVYYNPEDHSEAVLKPGVTKSINGTIAVGVVIVVAGIAQLFGFL